MEVEPIRKNNLVVRFTILAGRVSCLLHWCSQKTSSRHPLPPLNHSTSIPSGLLTTRPFGQTSE
jgi:hypothetical protein